MATEWKNGVSQRTQMGKSCETYKNMVGAKSLVLTPLIDPIFATSFEDQNIGVFDVNLHPAFWSIVANPYPNGGGSYALQGSGNDSTYISIIAHALPKYSSPITLYTRFYINFTGLASSIISLINVFNVGYYHRPYSDFVPQCTLGLQRYPTITGSPLYWAPNNLPQTSTTPVVTNQWYKVEAMLSESQLLYVVKIDDTIIFSHSMASNMQTNLKHIGFRTSPSSGTLTFLVDCLAAGYIGWLDDKYLTLQR